MSAVAFDTHRIVKRLKDAGFSDHQAETVTDVLSESRSVDVSLLATKADVLALRGELAADILALRGELKADVLALRSELKADMLALRGELKADISTLKGDLTAMETRLEAKLSDVKADIFKWVVPLMLGQSAVTAALVKLL